MSDQPCETPLTELVRNVPKDLRAEWEIQWFEDGTPCGHAMAPVGKYLHDLVDRIEQDAAEIGQWQEIGRYLLSLLEAEGDFVICVPAATMKKIQALTDSAVQGRNRDEDKQ